MLPSSMRRSNSTTNDTITQQYGHDYGSLPNCTGRSMSMSSIATSSTIAHPYIYPSNGPYSYPYSCAIVLLVALLFTLMLPPVQCIR